MFDIHALLNRLETQERELLTRKFIAPCTRGGRVRTQIDGLVCIFRPQPRDFSGWGMFQPADTKTAKLLETASLNRIEEYLQQFPAFRFLLVRSLQHQTWLAFPANLSDMQQRLGRAKPVPVHLVSEGIPFEPIVARWDGRAFWFEGCDRRADPLPSEALRQALRESLLPEDLTFGGLVPEMRTAYDLAIQGRGEFSPAAKDERRLQQALKIGGGNLESFRDRDDFWQVEWTTPNGERQTSAIAKSDLTVMSAGICLDERDRDFDLQSLVGVVEQQEDWN